MTNRVKYVGETHNHYVFERMCPRCSCSMCPRESSELRQCLITDVRDYKQWLLQEVDND